VRTRSLLKIGFSHAGLRCLIEFASHIGGEYNRGAP
jgi:hypothetical protein